MLLYSAYILSFISAFIYAVFYFKKSFEIDLKYFLAYLFFMFSFEMIASYVSYKGHDNLWVYNSLIFLEFNCLFLFSKEILVSKKAKKIVLKIIIIFNIIYFLANLISFDNFLTKYNSLASISGSFLITIVLFLFYKDFLDSNRILNYKKSLSFWIAFGLLFYYLGTIPFTSIINFLSDIPLEIKLYLIKIQIFLSLFMHSCFIFGILWSRKQVK